MHEEQIFETWKKLFEKANKISKGDTNSESYKEIFALWEDAYKNINKKYEEAFTPSKSELESFIENTEAFPHEFLLFYLIIFCHIAQLLCVISIVKQNVSRITFGQ